MNYNLLLQAIISAYTWFLVCLTIICGVVVISVLVYLVYLVITCEMKEKEVYHNKGRN